MLIHPLRLLFTLCILVSFTTTAQAARQARIRGTVTTSNGTAVSNAVVTVTCKEMEAFEKVVKCKKDGTYSLLLVDATRHYVFRVEAPDHIAVDREVKVPPGSTDNVIDIELRTPEEEKQALERQANQKPGYREIAEGRALYNEGKLEESRAKFEKAVELIPESVPAWTGLSSIAEELGDSEAALKGARKCLELDGEALNCLAVAINSARALGLEEEYDRLSVRYRELKPDDPAMLFNQAAEFLNNMDDEKARPLLEQCLAADPEFGQCLFELGMLLLRTGDLEGAKKTLQEYLRVDPEGADAATAAETLKYL